MIKTITKVGNSHGIILDATLMDLAHLRAGDKVNIEVHAGGTLTIAPMERAVISPNRAAAAAKGLIKKNAELFRRLS